MATSPWGSSIPTSAAITTCVRSSPARSTALFQVHGKITADFSFSVSVGVQTLGGLLNGSVVVFSLPLAQTTLFNTTQISTGNPFSQPLPATQSIDVVFDARLYDDSPTANNLYLDVENGNLNITYNLVLRATYPVATIHSLTIYGSDEDTLFYINANIPYVPVQINGGAGTNGLVFDDSGYTGTLAPTYNLHGSHLERDVFLHLAGLPVLLPTAQINFQGIQSVNVYGATQSHDDFYIYGLSVATTIHGGDQNNLYSVGGPQDTLDSVFDYLNLVGGSGYDQLILYDEGATSSANYTVHRDGLDWTRLFTFTFPGGVQTYFQLGHHLNYSSIDSIQIDGGAAGNTFTVDDVADANAVNPTAMTVVLNTGTGTDNVTVYATTGPVLIHGQGGNDVVTVGVANRGTLDVSGRVYVDNSSTPLHHGYTTLNINDADDSTQRTITLDTTADGYGTIDGFVGTHTYPNPFAPNQNTTIVAYKSSDVQSVNVQGGNNVNTFNVFDTPRSKAPLFGFGSSNHISTHLTLGTYINTVNVWGTTGPLTIAGSSSLNNVFLGGNSAALGNLGDLLGAVTLAGTFDQVAIKDAQKHGFRSYTMTADSFTGGGTAGIFFSAMNLNRISISLADGGNQVTVNGTPAGVGSGSGSGSDSGIDISTGKGNDSVQVNSSSSPLYLYLGGGSYQTVTIASAKESLDDIDDVNVYGSSIYGLVYGTAAAAEQIYNIDSVQGGIEQVERTQGEGDSTLNTFAFHFQDQGNVYLTAGKGGDTVNILGTVAHVNTFVYGGAGQDDIAIATDKSGLLGPVYVFGTAATHDRAAFYANDPNTPAQTYTFQSAAGIFSKATRFGQQVVQIAGDAPVVLQGIESLTANLPSVGSNQVSIQGVPAGETLHLVAANHDQITVGNGTLAQVRGTVSLENGEDVSATLDDSADTAARSVVLHPGADDSKGDFITGLAPATLYLPLNAASAVTLLGGKGNDTFALAGLVFGSAVRVDGGKGVNTLDYALVTDQPGYPNIEVDLAAGTATGLDGGIANIQKVRGLANTVVQTTTYNAAADFSAASNPNGVWSYGWTPSLGGSFMKDSDHVDTHGSGIDEWRGDLAGDGNPLVTRNATAANLIIDGVLHPVGQLIQHPGPGGQDSVVRWTAPADGLVTVQAIFTGADSSAGTTTDVHVLHDGMDIFDGNVTGYGNVASFGANVSSREGGHD